MRQLIREADDAVSDGELRELWDAAQSETAAVRLLGDLALAAFFDGAKPKDREARRKKFADEVLNGKADTYRPWLDDLRNADPPLAPFHWQIEFPEVFDRGKPGFDSIVGNPPFGGHVTVVAANIPGYTDWLRLTHPDSKGKCDVVAHFFRRSFDLIRPSGTLGLVATNTIAQGDTRVSGLRWICQNGGDIYHARRRVKWPGLAAVVVSVVHVSRETPCGIRRLDGEPVERITAFLFHRGNHDDPAQLATNSGRSFQGIITLGMGFTFDDTDNKGVATSLAEMRRLIEQDSRNAEVILPYIGGEEVNTHPTHTHHRFVIHFKDHPLRREKLEVSWVDAISDTRQEYLRRGIVPFDYPGAVAADWPDLLDIVEDKVKPERLLSAQRSKSTHSQRAAVWWQLYHQAKELYIVIGDLDRVLVISYVGQHGSLTFLQTGAAFAGTLVIFPFDTYTAFGILQSRLHNTWSHFFGSSMKDDLRYTPSDCFETFPFPKDWRPIPIWKSSASSTTSSERL